MMSVLYKIAECLPFFSFAASRIKSELAVWRCFVMCLFLLLWLFVCPHALNRYPCLLILHTALVPLDRSRGVAAWHARHYTSVSF